MFTKVKNKTFKIIKYLSWLDWLALAATIGLTIALPIIFNVAFDNQVSYILSVLSSTMGIIATFFIAKGRRIGILFDSFALILIGLNLVIFSTVTQDIMGYIYLCFVLPCMLFTFIYWGKIKKKNGVVEGKKLSGLGWGFSFFMIGMFSLLFVSIKNFNGGLEDSWTTGDDAIILVNSLIECVSAATIIVLTVLYVFAYKEFWTFWSMLLILSIVMYFTNYYIEPNPMAICFIVSDFINLALAFYGWLSWVFVNNKNKSNPSELSNVKKDQNIGTILT